MFLSRLLNLNGIDSCLQIYMSFSRLNWATSWKRSWDDIFQFFALDFTKRYRNFFSFCSVAYLAKCCFRKVNFALNSSLWLIKANARNVSFIVFQGASNLTLVNVFARYNFVFHFPIDTAPQLTIFSEAQPFFLKGSLWIRRWIGGSMKS